LKIFETKVTRRIIGVRKEDMTQDGENYKGEEIHDLYISLKWILEV
jgi:uncharacterized protein (UPF0335 family)